MNNDERHVFDLTPEEQAKLLTVKTVEDIQDIKFIRTWMADGLPAVALSLNGVELAFYDLDTDAAASLMNPSYTDAKLSVIRLLRARFAQMNADQLDDDDEFEQDDSYGETDSYGGGSWG